MQSAQFWGKHVSSQKTIASEDKRQTAMELNNYFTSKESVPMNAFVRGWANDGYLIFSDWNLVNMRDSSIGKIGKFREQFIF